MLVFIVGLLNTVFPHLLPVYCNLSYPMPLTCILILPLYLWLRLSKVVFAGQAFREQFYMFLASVQSQEYCMPPHPRLLLLSLITLCLIQ